jgi:16S rRNA (uracil1498-N3)-methyltransferase
MVRLFLPLDGTPAQTRVEGERLHYLARVRRLSAGDALEVFDGKGRAFPARITELDDTHAQLRLDPPREVPSGTPVFLVQGLPKGDKLELVLQKATELGASGFLPVETERAVVKLAGSRAEDRRVRWQRIVEEAARQCGRADVPAVEPVRRLLDAIDALPPGTRVLVLDEEERARRLTDALVPGAPIALVIGPEGGLARAEVDALSSRGALPVTLGRLVLRTETASLAALAVIRHLDGALG